MSIHVHQIIEDKGLNDNTNNFNEKQKGYRFLKYIYYTVTQIVASKEGYTKDGIRMSFLTRDDLCLQNRMI